MDELCTACLCSGRNLFSTEGSEVHKIYTQILNEESISGEMLSICLQVCWECQALLRRFYRFKKQARECYVKLMEVSHQNIRNVKTKSKLERMQVYNVSYPEVVVKMELDVDIKSETVEEPDMHQEPETFVKDLAPQKRMPKVKEKKASKKKTRQRAPAKRKKAAKEKETSDGESDFDGPDAVDAASEHPCHDDGRRGRDGGDDGRDGDDGGDGGDLDRDGDDGPDGEERVAPPAPLPRGGTGRARSPLPEKPQCVECGKMFSSRKTYRYHLNVLHRGQNRYPCPRCGKVYQWKSNLGRHLRSHKARDDGELHCAACDKRFASVATYRQHLRVSRRHVSEDDFAFVCDECGKRFANKTRLRDHIDWEHLHKIKFRCQLCDKPFKCHTSLYVHLQNVHRDKEKKDNLCHVCGKSYPNAAKLRYHIVALHTGETPYRCAQCGAAFGWYSSLYRHVREVHCKMKLPRRSRRAPSPAPPPPASARAPQ